MSYTHLPTDCHEYHPAAFAALAERTARPTVVCICGSMRFMDAMLAVSVGESLAGRIVVLPLVNMKEPDSRWSTEEKRERIKTGLDRLHFAKIDYADEVLVVNPGRYVGDSTRQEITYATERGKPVRYLVPMEDVRAGAPVAKDTGEAPRQIGGAS